MVNNSWKESSLTDLCSVQIGLTHTPKYILHGVPFLSAKDLNNGELSFKDAKYISQEEFLTISDAAKPKNGDIVFGRVGTLGNPCIVNTENDFAIFVSLGYEFKKLCSNSYTEEIQKNIEIYMSIVGCDDFDNRFKKYLQI